jgi:hypothetical protein
MSDVQKSTGYHDVWKSLLASDQVYYKKPFKISPTELTNLVKEYDALKDRLEKCHRYACVPGNCRLDGENCSAQPEYKR